jgi:HEPN domain-containing protein
MDIVEKWFKKAKSDLNVAEHSFNSMQPKELDIVCFHCQQAVEKVLKAYLVLHDIDPPKVHKLETLCEMCMEYDNSFSLFFDICTKMTKYAVETRYPDDVFNINETETKQALENAKNVYDFCRTKLLEQKTQ